MPRAHRRLPTAAAPAAASLVVLAALASGCATPPQVTAQRFGTAVVPARPVDAPVALYADERPACAFTKVGYVKVEGQDARDRERLPALVRAAARELGGDAVVDYTATEFRSSVVGTHPFAPLGNPPLEAAWIGGSPGRAAGAAPGTGLVLAGTVIRYVDGCPSA